MYDKNEIKRPPAVQRVLDAIDNSEFQLASPKARAELANSVIGEIIEVNDIKFLIVSATITDDDGLSLDLSRADMASIFIDWVRINNLIPDGWQLSLAIEVLTAVRNDDPLYFLQLKRRYDERKTEATVNVLEIVENFMAIYSSEEVGNDSKWLSPQ